MRSRTLMMTVMLLAAANAASAQTIAGKWTATFPMRVRMENGTPSAEQEGNATVILEQKGDSVFGTWQTENALAPVKARQLKGIYKAGKLLLEASPVEAQIKTSDSGDSKIMMVTYYEATLSGDALDGNMHSRSEDGSIESPRMKWSAKRSVSE